MRMNSPLPSSHRSGRDTGARAIRHPGGSAGTPRSASGFALVVVMGMLVLVAVLVVAFLSSVSTELQSAKSYADETKARSLADSAVNIVISQIQDATATPEYAWASQPGMIRTYDDTGEAVAAYKLYSSGQLRVGGSYNPIANFSAEIPNNWASPANANLYTDLNKPVSVGGVRHYPIISPEAVAPLESPDSALEGAAPPIEGAFLDTANAAIATSASQTNPVPMPVQWLYVLKNGRLVAMDPTTRKVAGAGETLPDGSVNSIIGRVAFWTDDETGKVNINTASEGTYWDRPWADAPVIQKESGGTIDVLKAGYEKQLALSMPTQGEFQRYPGHPAMTSLSPVFPRFNNESELDYKNRIYGIIPKIVGGGSNGGTMVVNHTAVPLVMDTDRLFASVDEFIFHATAFTEDPVTKEEVRVLNPLKENDNLIPGEIERSRFFLTATSRAPEVNLFNKPRVTLWPLQANTGNVADPANAAARNAQDRLIAFCSTIGARPYYFQRYNTYTSATQNPIPSSQSPTMDWNLIPRNQELYRYLQTLTSAPIPGLGGTIASKYPRSRDQILTQMWDFTRSSVNTFSTGSAPKYFYAPFDSNPGNLVPGHSQVVPLVLPNGTKGFGRFSTITEAALVFYRKDPLRITGTVPSGGSVTMNGTKTDYPEGRVFENELIPDMPLSESIRLTGEEFELSEETAPEHEIGVVLILEPFNPSPGPPPWSHHARFVVTGLEYLNMGFASGPLVNMVSSLDSTINSTALTGLESFLQRPPRMPKTLGPTVEDNPDPQFYPFYGSFTATGTTFNIPETPITIKIYQGTSRALNDDDLVQTIHLRFPKVDNLPLPKLAHKKVDKGETIITLASKQHDTLRDFDKRLSYLRRPTVQNGRYGIAEDNAHAPLPLVSGWTVNPWAGDTVRSVEARYGGVARGDYRLFAALPEVPETFFEGHGTVDTPKDNRKYSDKEESARLIHSLTIDGMAGPSDTSNANGYYAGAGASGDPRGRLLPGNTVTYLDPNRGNNARNRKVPIVPRGLEGAYMSGTILGDWDTGIASQPDGPYINKADETTSNAKANSTQYLPLYYSTGLSYGDSTYIIEGEAGGSFSPNRQIASAVAFGSLPSAIDPADPANSTPWRTLLFAKNPLAGPDHPGFGTPRAGPPYTTPPDHAFLDLFTMPIVEPYAISEPFSTAGKVNMNYQIVPFTYLSRDTAVRAALKSLRIMAIPNSAGTSYKWGANNPSDFRYSLNLDRDGGTLQGFEERFNSGDIFRSASEICDIYLVPGESVNPGQAAAGAVYKDMEEWWENYMLTGDNVRESPYGNLYPRLTTKSNTYTVHVITQSLMKSKTTPADEFVEGRDHVTGEFRGSFIIQRYLDPNADSLVKADGTPTNENDPEGMVGPYKFQIISTKRFAP